MPSCFGMDDLFAIYGTRLDAAGIEYMITGSVAAMVYGEPRLTHDIDLVVAMPAGAIDRFAAQFPDEDFYCAPTEVIRVVDDVRAMLRVAGERIDRDEISTRATAMGLGMQWDEVQAVPASPGRP